MSAKSEKAFPVKSLVPVITQLTWVPPPSGRKPKSSWLTGEVLDLNGGAHLKRYPDVLGHVMKLAENQ